ncbi:hypothetical protein M404DRAFT_1008366 [Pisolithus tinctorius Marx 270]|uniref:Uncharacterized protein n=1 Tax=Pisolithus tinctorius Marx 270 TaxID=870435 RepID=A0A0C3MZW1_PISTI|nr:hypothetical protein M404DRAFT_1008366 [Pisolithus tinctorius Marx 270]
MVASWDHSSDPCASLLSIFYESTFMPKSEHLLSIGSQSRPQIRGGNSHLAATNHPSGTTNTYHGGRPAELRLHVHRGKHSEHSGQGRPAGPVGSIHGASPYHIQFCDHDHHTHRQLWPSWKEWKLAKQGHGPLGLDSTVHDYSSCLKIAFTIAGKCRVNRECTEQLQSGHVLVEHITPTCPIANKHSLSFDGGTWNRYVPQTLLHMPSHLQCVPKKELKNISTSQRASYHILERKVTMCSTHPRRSTGAEETRISDRLPA